MADQALSGVTVCDLTHHIAGPFCTKLMADNGAEVIKVERPGVGDPTRHVGPFFHDDPHPEKSGLFLHLNTNKRSVTLNLKSREGRRVLLRMVEHADILVESFSPRVMPSLGLSYDTLAQVNPRLVMVSVSNFGQTGPYRDYKSEEIVTYAMGGPMSATGQPEREPIKLGGNVIQYHAGASAAVAAMTALWAAEETGRGDHVDVSMMRAQASSMDRRTTMLVTYQYTGEVSSRRPAGSAVGVGVRPVADGYVSMTGDINRFRRLADMVGHPELVQDPRFQGANFSKPGRSEEFDELLIPWLLQFTKREAFRQLQESDIPSGPIYDVSDVLSDPHFSQRGAWETIDHPATGKLTYPGRPFLMGATPWRVRRPAPLLGEHNREVLCGLLGFSAEELSGLRRSGVV